MRPRLLHSIACSTIVSIIASDTSTAGLHSIDYNVSLISRVVAHKPDCRSQMKPLLALNMYNSVLSATV